VNHLLTLGEAAQALACSVATVKRRIAAGELPVVVDGRLRRVSEDDLRRYIAERTCRRLPGGGTRPAAGTTVVGRLWD